MSTGFKKLPKLTANETEVTNRFKNVEVSIERGGKKIILPSDPAEMSIDEAVNSLQRLKKQEDSDVEVYEEVNAFPLEGAYALNEALRRLYGWANQIPTPGFFGSSNPPAMAGVEIAPNEFVQVPWGRMEIPGIQGYLETHTSHSRLPKFIVGGVVKQKYLPQVKAIAELTRKIVAEESIYRGKALRLSTNEDGDVNFKSGIKFLDLSKVNEDELVFPEETMTQIRVNLFTPIENPEVCRKHKVPLSRKVLFEGPYGVGKTITAYVAAQKATQHGWTFIYLDRVHGLQDALLFAKQYAPAVIFAEDIDRIMDGERDTSTDDVLNTIDGVDTKGCEIMTILTTNNVWSIHPAMLRPGRLDSVISVRAPDAKAAEKLVRVYARELIDKKEDLTKVGKSLAGNIPATIREVVERSKLYAIGRGSTGAKIRVTADDLLWAAEGMKAHLEFLKGKPQQETPADRFYDSFKGLVGESTGSALEKVENQVTKIYERIQ